MVAKTNPKPIGNVHPKWKKASSRLSLSEKDLFPAHESLSLPKTLFPPLPLGTPILDTGIGLGVILCLSLSYMVVDMRIPPGQ